MYKQVVHIFHCLQAHNMKIDNDMLASSEMFNCKNLFFFANGGKNHIEDQMSNKKCKDSWRGMDPLFLVVASWTIHLP